MKSKAILVSLLAIFAVLTLTVLVRADLVANDDEAFRVSVKGVEFINIFEDTVSVDAGETIPIRVVFAAGEDASDVKVKAEISGFRDDVEDATGRFDIVEGKTYSKLLSLKIPSDVDPEEDATLTIRIEAKGKDGFRKEIPLLVQREPYNLEVLSVDASKEATAGSTLAVNVVLKNMGSHELEDTFVVVRIPALNVEKRAYFSDLSATDGRIIYLDKSEFDWPNERITVRESSDREDSAERTVFLTIPSDAKAGVYSLEVEAYNSDASEKTTKSISIVGSEQKSDVLTAVLSKDVQSGQTVTYDLVVINSGDKIAVYTIVPENAQNLIVSVDEPIITVPADSSKTVKVSATAGEVMGTFNFAVNVNSQDKLVKRVNFSANVGKKAITSNVTVLTVVLAIVFVVLLIVLIVLLTRKPEKTEELGESYY